MDSAPNLIARAITDAGDSVEDGPDPRLHTAEYLPDGIRRIAREQLIDARYSLSKPSGRRLAAAVHESRKQLKLVRALLRLARDGLGEETYKGENASLRRAGQRLSPARDAQVLFDTLETLRERLDHELPGDATDFLCARLEDDRQRAEAALRKDAREIEAVLGGLDEALARTSDWSLQPDDFAALSPGLRRTYRRGVRALRAARRDPSAENLHEFRKRVNDLRHASEVLCEARPKRLHKVAERAHEVGDLLGDNHDLYVLREYVLAHPQCFADEDAKQALLDVIDTRAALLCKRALKRGKRLYELSPKGFVRWVERGWNARAGGASLGG